MAKAVDRINGSEQVLVAPDGPYTTRLDGATVMSQKTSPDDPALQAICKHCGQAFAKSRPSAQRQFCSRACKAASQVRHNNESRPCRQCQAVFVPQGANPGIYCSKRCLASSLRKPNDIRQAKVKTHLVCRKCGADWQHTENITRTACPYCGASKDARDRRDEAARSKHAIRRKKALGTYTANPANRRKLARAAYALRRKRVFFRICGSIHPTCVRCGCDDPRLLEINHKNGGGNREMQKGKYSSQFLYAVVKGTRKTDDLELLCKPCNAIHALELRYGPLPIRVTWKTGQTPTGD